MPTYRYVCKECQTVKEVSHPMSHEPVIYCEQCSKPRRKALSAPTTIFKGTGWGGNHPKGDK